MFIEENFESVLFCKINSFYTLNSETIRCLLVVIFLFKVEVQLHITNYPSLDIASSLKFHLNIKIFTALA